MGQYFVIINIDKEQRIDISKFGEGYLDTQTAYLCNAKVEASWAGDRLILIGNCSRDIPAGIKEENDTIEMFTYHGSSTGPPYVAGAYYKETSVLRNLCTREYIRADLFPEFSSHPGLGEVLLPKIVWSTDPNMAMPAEIDPRGPWAGGRFDIVDIDAVKEDPQWKDISEIEFFNYYTMWSIDMGVVDRCACKLCQKYRDEHEEFYENHKMQSLSQDAERLHKSINEGGNPRSRDGTHVIPLASTSLSTIEKLPPELQEEIMVYMSLGELVVCAAASKKLSSQATRRLYSSVELEHAGQTKILLETISRRPELTDYVKRLRVVTMAHWESLQLAHEILMRLPGLKSLEFAPCWFSYGDLPYWEYPFTLSTMTWGLKQDFAFKQFCQSQSGAQILLLDPVIIISEEEEEDEEEM